MKIVLIYEYGILNEAYIVKDEEEANKIFKERIGIDFEEFEQDSTNYQSNAGSTVIEPTNQSVIDSGSLVFSIKEADN